MLFDKFVSGWSPEWNAPVPDDAKRDFYRAAAGRSRGHLAEGLTSALNRRRRLVGTLDGKTLPVATDWRLVSGLGTGHPFETGFIWHRTLGVPYLPGSSVKGVVRAWAQDWTEDRNKEETVRRLFGPEDAEARVEAHAGSLIVFDALPVSPPLLEVYVMNPHYAPYYMRAEPPADYHSPTPIFFLTVAPGQWFEFAVARRPGASGNDVETGIALLHDALSTIGVGGKTAVGYGVFTNGQGQS
ncbi:MAG: type III-B CRISPR module RAMP protein Cmr6 [Candidatus Rokubacteria bacterium]|nr:type III-B CRISPR module RAMP protein Cmr6 [Candidatus Rokubacteria bacterium]